MHYQNNVAKIFCVFYELERVTKSIEMININMRQDQASLKHPTSNSSPNTSAIIKAPNADLINSIDKNGLTPLQLAVQNQDIENVILLLEHGANPNQNSPLEDAPLIIAVRNNNVGIASKLLEEGANVNILDRQEQSVLKIATNFKAEKCLELLLEYGAHFSSTPRSSRTLEKNSSPQEFIDQMICLLIDIADSKNTPERFKAFYKTLSENLQLLFVHQQNLDISSIKKDLQVIFEQMMC